MSSPVQRNSPEGTQQSSSIPPLETSSTLPLDSAALDVFAAISEARDGHQRGSGGPLRGIRCDKEGCLKRVPLVFQETLCACNKRFCDKHRYFRSHECLTQEQYREYQKAKKAERENPDKEKSNAIQRHQYAGREGNNAY